MFESEHFKKQAGLLTFTPSVSEWINKTNKSNVRDFATINELTVLSNLESHNAQMIKEGKGKEERIKSLQEIIKKIAKRLSKEQYEYLQHLITECTEK